MAFTRLITNGWLWLLCGLLFTQWASAQSWPLQLKLQNNGQLHQLQHKPNQSSAELGMYKAQSGVELYLSGDWLIQTSQTAEKAMWQQLGVDKAKLLAQIGSQQIWLVRPVKSELWFDRTLPLEKFSWLQAYQPDFHAKATKVAKQQGNNVQNAKLSDQRQAILTPAYWQALQQQTAGEEAVIALIDDAVTLTAPALAELQLQLYYDVDQKSTQQAASVKVHSHGDKMADLLFASGNSTNSVSTTSGLAPKAKAVLLKQSLGWTSDMLLALHLAELEQADIINCSWTLPFLSDLIAAKINDLTQITVGKTGVTVVVAAGNQRRDVAALNPLAALASVVSVGLLDSKKQPLSNTGKVDIWVQGPLYLTDGKSISGSSAAAAVVSGVLALKRSLQPEQSMSSLTEQLKTELTTAKQ